MNSSDNQTGEPAKNASAASARREELTKALIEWIDRTLPKLRIFNSQVAEWTLNTSWWRLVFLGFFVLIVTALLGDILNIGGPTVIMDDEHPTPVKIEVQTDEQGGVVISPSVNGKHGKPIKVPMPAMPPVPPAPPAAPGAPNAPATTPQVRLFGKTFPLEKGAPDVHDGRDSLGGKTITIEKDGKKIIIGSHGVVVLEPGETAKAEGAEKSPTPARDSGATAKSDAVEAQQDAEDARQTAEQAQQEAEQKWHEEVNNAIESAKDDIAQQVTDNIAQSGKMVGKQRERVWLWDFTKALIFLSIAYLLGLKIVASNKRKADAMVRSAAETAERESLQRQVSEARLQMMQAQVEPHFLFNTLASVDYLIETDPARASMMQKNLIQYLRAALPQMRERGTNLGREVELVRAFLEILRVRMEERLQISFQVPDGLRSADFPPMMLQSLVENAIKHGLEPKPEGGRITVSAEVIDGDLFVCVADTGMGFNAAGAPTSGTGVGLTNIRERLKLLYGETAQLVIESNQPSGMRASIMLPYLPRARAART